VWHSIALSYRFSLLIGCCPPASRPHMEPLLRLVWLWLALRAQPKWCMSVTQKCIAASHVAGAAGPS